MFWNNAFWTSFTLPPCLVNLLNSTHIHPTTQKYICSLAHSQATTDLILSWSQGIWWRSIFWKQHPGRSTPSAQPSPSRKWRRRAADSDCFCPRSDGAAAAAARLHPPAPPTQRPQPLLNTTTADESVSRSGTCCYRTLQACFTADGLQLHNEETLKSAETVKTPVIWQDSVFVHLTWGELSSHWLSLSHMIYFRDGLHIK